MAHVVESVMGVFSADFSADLDKDMQNYWALDENEAADTPSPLLFIGFPSAKDPTWESRYPGNKLSAKSRVIWRIKILEN